MDDKAKQGILNDSILIGRCNCDNVVRFPFYWAEQVLVEAGKLGFKIIDLKKENFTGENFLKQMKSYNPKFVFLNGHGDKYCARGYKECPVLAADINDYLLKDKVAHIISCKTASVLGHSAIGKGCRGYIGYEGLFAIWNVKIAPKDNIVSKILMEAVNIVSLTLMEGGTVKEAYEKSQKVYQRHIETCIKHFFGVQEGDESIRGSLGEILVILRNNKKKQIYLSLEK